MPKSKVRKKSVYTPPEGVLQSRTAQARAAQPSPRWYAVVMVALMVIGLLWIVVYYVAGDKIPFMVSLSARGISRSVSARWSPAWSCRCAGADTRPARPAPAEALVPSWGRGPLVVGAAHTVHRRELRPQVDMALHPQGCPPSVERRNGPAPR